MVMTRFGVRDYANGVVAFERKYEPARIARAAAKRLARAKRREEAKSRNAAELLAHERKNGVSARSWRAAILARVVAGQVDSDE